MEDKGCALLNAYQFVLTKGEAVRKAARLYGVPETTLRRRINHPDLFEKNVGHPTMFTKAEEAQLADHCKRMARVGYGYCRWQVMELATNMMTAIGKQNQPKKDWYYGFIKRFPDLKIQKPKKREVSRVLATTQANIDEYFREVEVILDKYELKNKPDQIWNVDETGITLDHNPPKIVSSKHDKPFVVTAGRSVNTTVIVAGNALGKTIPPYIIYKGQRLTSELTNGCLPGTKYAMTKTGWSTSETFQDFLLNHFITHIENRPCILLYDGHTTHITVNIIEKARENNVHLFVLPPHSSHQLQPLDVGIFSSFKSTLSSECHKLSHAQVGRQVTRQDLPALISSAYESSVTVANLMSSFRKSGLVPFNPEAVSQPPLISETVLPKSRMERSNVRNIKLLLTEVDKHVTESLKNKSYRNRKYIIPPCGTAITETEFLEKLKDANDINKETKLGQKVGKGKENTNENKTKDKVTVAQKRKLKLNGTEECTVGKTKKQVTSQHEIERADNQIADSQQPGPSTVKDAWATYYNSEDGGDDDDDDAVCCICNLFSPKNFRAGGNLEILSWAKCDVCKGWVHLKYCSPIRSLLNGQPFKCSKC